MRVEHVDDARHARFGGPAARIAGQRHRAGGAAVIRAVAREDLVAAGERARDLDRVLVGVGAAVGEEEDVDVAGREARQLRPELRARLGGHERARVRQHRRLLGDRARHALVAVADVHAHQLAVEVEVALAFRRPEVHALGARHRDRIDGSLRGPFEDGVLAAEIDDLRAGHRRSGCRRGRHCTCLPEVQSLQTLERSLIQRRASEVLREFSVGRAGCRIACRPSSSGFASGSGSLPCSPRPYRCRQ